MSNENDPPVSLVLTRPCGEGEEGEAHEAFYVLAQFVRWTIVLYCLVLTAVGWLAHGSCLRVFRIFILNS